MGNISFERLDHLSALYNIPWFPFYIICFWEYEEYDYYKPLENNYSATVVRSNYCASCLYICNIVLGSDVTKYSQTPQYRRGCTNNLRS